MYMSRSEFLDLVRGAVGEAIHLAENSLGCREALLEKLSLLEDHAASQLLQAQSPALTAEPSWTRPAEPRPSALFHVEAPRAAGRAWMGGLPGDVLESILSAPTYQNPSSPQRSDVVALVGQPPGMPVSPSHSGGAYADPVATATVWNDVHARGVEAFGAWLRANSGS